MTMYRKKPVVIEAITFDELVEHGKAEVQKRGGIPYKGAPLCFDYKGYQITRCRDDCYQIPTLEGITHFQRGHMLITGVAGELYPCELSIFAATYESAEPAPHWWLEDDYIEGVTCSAELYERAYDATGGNISAIAIAMAHIVAFLVERSHLGNEDLQQVIAYVQSKIAETRERKSRPKDVEDPN